MKLQGLLAAPLVALLAVAMAAVPDGLPEGWWRVGAAKDCKVSTEAVAGAPTPKAFSVACPAGTQGFAGAAQSISAANHAGRRVRLSAQVQGDAIDGKGGLWLRADAGQKTGVAFDNMYERPLTGSFAWKTASVVLDIPAESQSLHFGLLLTGDGTLRATRFVLEEVGRDVPTTAETPRDTLPREPVNMSPR